MSAPGPLAYVLNTPAHHHIHHSTDPKHFDKNLGYCLIVWDWVFGTLYLPEKRQKITFGLGNEQPPHTLKASLVTPLVLAGKRLRPHR